ncbi:MAG: hypothetical protein U0075_06630 [Thermomicrobiales bacterium]
MDSSRFDLLARALGDAGTDRRTLTGLLGGAFLSALPIATEARKERRRRKHRDDARQHDHDADVDSEKKKKKKKKKCKPDSTAVTCAGKCGSVTNNCKQAVNCGSCACSPACEACFTCQASANTPGTCVVDPQKVGQTCGGSGQVCQANGDCLCSDSACSNPTPVCGQEVCEVCTNAAQCQAAGKGDICCNGSCFSGDCCDNSECTDPTKPICTEHVCSPCTSTSQCGNKEICDNGGCQSCDVCAQGCTYTTPQAAIDDATVTTTIRICPGTYGRIYKHTIDPDVTLIGAGDGTDAASNTILTDPGDDGHVARFEGGTSTLRRTRVTGGNGGGVLNNFATLTMIDCTVSNNTARPGGFVGGGIENNGALSLTNVNVENNTAVTQGGGIYNFSGNTITFTGSNLVANNKLTDNVGTPPGSGIFNDGTIIGLDTVTIRDNDPATDQCHNCLA